MHPLKCYLGPNTGEIIERAVKIAPEEDIHEVSRISYCPKEKMTRWMEEHFQRCNLPGQEMFYGSIIEPYEDSENFSAMVSTSICESSEFYRNPNSPDGDEFYAFGGWHAKEDICCMMILDPARDYQLRFLIEAQEAQKKILRDKGLKNGQLYKRLVSAFTSPAKCDEDYKVTAAFADFVFTNYPDVDAILYPSIQTNAQGLCIAIKPSVIDSGKIVAHRVLKDVVSKRGNRITAKIIEAANIEDGTLTFALQPYGKNP